MLFSLLWPVLAVRFAPQNQSLALVLALWRLALCDSSGIAGFRLLAGSRCSPFSLCDLPAAPLAGYGFTADGRTASIRHLYNNGVALVRWST